MRILRIRHGFQADHSSSSYLFYAAERPVGPEGQQIAHRYSSSAEVGRRSARYHKWGERSLSDAAFKALLGKHYDIMVSESYDWWTLMIAVPKTAEMKDLLKPFRDARGYDDLGVDVEDYGRWLVVVVYCAFDANGANFESETQDPFERLARLLARVRAEILRGDTSFLQAVVSFYQEDEEEESAENGGAAATGQPLPEHLSKAELQALCASRGIPYRKTWAKAQLRKAIEATTLPKPRDSGVRRKRPKLSRAAEEIADNLERV